MRYAGTVKQHNFEWKSLSIVHEERMNEEFSPKNCDGERGGKAS